MMISENKEGKICTNWNSTTNASSPLTNPTPISVFIFERDIDTGNKKTLNVRPLSRKM